MYKNGSTYPGMIDNDKYYNDNARMYADSERLRSDGTTATYMSLMNLIGQIIDLTNEERQRPITFVPFASYEKSDDISTPIITHSVYTRTPMEQRPRIREHVRDNENPDNIITIYGQKFVYTVEFLSIDSTYIDAENTMQEFEDLMLTYAWYFKQQGVSDIRFDEQTPDEGLPIKETAFGKGLKYNITLEKITLASDVKIKKIISNIKTD
jgi:hypothetical protein